MSKKNKKIPKINIFLLGDSAVGKTSFILRYTKNTYSNYYISTVGIDFMDRDIILPTNEKVKICFYDTAGQEQYKSIAFNLIKSAEGILLMYDICSQKSFESINEWIESIKGAKGDDFPVVLIGNKCDLEEERKVKTEQGINLADNNGFTFFETSNKENINIEQSVSSLATKVLEKRKIEKNQKEFLKLEKKKMKKKKRC